MTRTCDKVFVVAMDGEVEAVRVHLKDVCETAVCGHRLYEGTLDGEPTAIVASGIGKDNAAAAAMLALLRYRPRMLLNAGVAGSLRETMTPGRVYGITEVTEYDFDLAECNGTQIGVLPEYATQVLALTRVPGFPPARLGTADRFVDTEEDYRLLTDVVPVDLRDMEGASIAHVAARAGVACAMLKAVSDVHGRARKTVRQFAANLKRAEASLSAAIPGFFTRVDPAGLEPTTRRL